MILADKIIDERKKAFEGTYSMSLALGVVLCIVSVVPMFFAVMLGLCDSPLGRISGSPCRLGVLPRRIREGYYPGFTSRGQRWRSIIATANDERLRGRCNLGYSRKGK